MEQTVESDRIFSRADGDRLPSGFDTTVGLNGGVGIHGGSIAEDLGTIGRTGDGQGRGVTVGEVSVLTM